MVDQWVKLELDVGGFDARRFEPYVERCLQRGMRLTTLADLGDTAGNRRLLYELNKECAADIPGRGEFFAFDEYLEARIDVPSFGPRGVVITLNGSEWIGMAATSDRRSSGCVFNEMTGVKADYRGQGIAIAMKTFGIGFAGLCGVSRIRTVHHAANGRAIALNRRLGYLDAEWAEP